MNRRFRALNAAVAIQRQPYDRVLDTIQSAIASASDADAAMATATRLLHAGVPHYTCLATADSYSVGKRLGFVPVSPSDDRMGGIFRAPAVMPRMRKQQDTIDVKVVETFDELEQAKQLGADMQSYRLNRGLVLARTQRV